MIHYPQELNIIFRKLKSFKVTPIIVGGYIRDALLNIDSKDIDIELYGISSLDKLELYLEEFGKVNSVGKSFGVTKLQFKGFDLDFSLPRLDSKSTEGHKGFEIKIDTTLDFKTAASRRDFTINAIGYNLFKKKILDPFHGQEDIEKKVLRAVDEKKFQEDPLRIFRAIGFSSRFNFHIENNLLTLLKEMVEKKLIDELARERIFIEVEKFLLKSPKPSQAFYTIKKLNAQNYFLELFELSNLAFKQTMKAIDTPTQRDTILLFAILTHKINHPKRFLHRFTSEKKLINSVLALIEAIPIINLKKIDNYTVYKLASHIKIEQFIPFLEAISDNKIEIDALKDLALELGVYREEYKPFIYGKDLISLGIKPSKEFSALIKKAYEHQIRGEFSDKESAIKWLKSMF
jgi:tRNA nucleotidyltransferase (CCA-adding enzyme)